VLARQAGIGYYKAYARILEERPELYVKYKNSKLLDFSGDR
jgi:hypothetical protein